MSLEQQLLNLQSKSIISSKKKPSLLFDVKQAADIDRETIFIVSFKALEELEAQEPRFAQFKQNLFSNASKDNDRNLMTKIQNQQINEQISLFLRYLSPFYLQSQSFKVLEWLIRRFEINEMNVSVILECILPFHETSHFTKFVSILDVKDDFSFLKTVQKSMVPLTRKVLVATIIKNKSLLTFILKMVFL
jgi:hypothetical protein